jgi:chemotaxis protein MotB
VNKNREGPVIIIVKKKGHGGGHHGGAWKVAFADFMTAMFALFLVLWLIDQSSDVKSAVAGYFQDPLGRADEFGSSILPGEGSQSSVPQPLSPQQVIDLRRDRMRSLGDQIDRQLRDIPDLKEVSDKIEIEVTEEGLRIQLLEDAAGTFYQSGSAQLSPRGKELLMLLGAQLGKLSNQVRLEGFTDARPFTGRPDYSNWELSSDRANAARRILAAGGMKDSQLQQVRGLADRELRVPTDPFSPRNRRVAITVLLPTEEEAAQAASAQAASAQAASVQATTVQKPPKPAVADSAGAALPAVVPGGPR